MYIIGIRWNPPHFQAAHIRSNRHGIEIISLENVKQIYNPNSRRKIVTGLSGNDLLIRNQTLKIQSQRHLEEVLQFQLETTSHLSPSEVISVSLLRENKKDRTTEATFITVLREVVHSHLKLYSTLEVVPDRVSAVPQALLQYALWKNPGLTQAFLIDLGSSEWTCIWIEEGQLKKSFSFPGGIEELLEALWEDRKKVLLQKEVEGVGRQIDLLQLKPHLNPNLSKKLNEKRKEIAKAIFSFSRQSELCPIFFTGRTDSFVHIREFLIESFQDAIVEGVKIPPPEEEHKYAISIGLALEETVPEKGAIQFLKEEFFPKKNWKKAGIYSLVLFTASLLCSGALIGWCQHNYDKKGQEIVSSIKHLINRYSPELKREILQENDPPDQTIHRWVSAIEKNNKEDPYLLPIPKVSDVLYWLSHHPLLEAFRKGGDPIKWKEMRYRLINIPKIGSSSGDSKVQVEIEFSISNSMNARKLHEALLKGDPFIDSKEKVGWEILPNGYRATFYLKQRDFDVS